jgi:hypothetical protein
VCIRWSSNALRTCNRDFAIWALRGVAKYYYQYYKCGPTIQAISLIYRQCVRCKLYMHRRHYTTLQHGLVQCNIKFLCSWKQNVSSMFCLLDVQINVYKRDTKYLNVSTDIPHRTIRINTATNCFFESFRRNLKHCSL